MEEKGRSISADDDCDRDDHGAGLRVTRDAGCALLWAAEAEGVDFAGRLLPLPGAAATHHSHGAAPATGSAAAAWRQHYSPLGMQPRGLSRPASTLHRPHGGVAAMAAHA
jgi:hypothetical protein